MASDGYRPLPEVRRTLRVKWYRSPIESRRLRELMQRGGAQAFGHLALLTATGVTTYLLFARQMWVPFAVALFLHGTVGSFVSAGVHELSHGTVFRTKWVNHVLMRIYSLIDWTNPHDSHLSHAYHHRYTLHPDGDREIILPQ